MGIPDFSIEFMTIIWGRASARPLFFRQNFGSMRGWLAADDELRREVAQTGFRVFGTFDD